ncbi:MAG: SRPBCC family protein [Vulcanimicrobiaceae bacterium]|jgi:uncharacterized protein YndB with AHSA1/START domain
MIELPCEAEIECSAERVFDLITDMHGQSRWLPHSPAFRGTADLSANPVVLGTTYREPSLFGTRHGTVTEYERPAAITFHQPMTMALNTGTVDITMRYTLTPDGPATRVRRIVTIDIRRNSASWRLSSRTRSAPKAAGRYSRSKPTPTPCRRNRGD